MKIIKQCTILSTLVTLSTFSNSSVSASQKTIHDMPPEILSEILSYLDTSSLGKAAQVSKGFKKAACKVLEKHRLDKALKDVCELSETISEDRLQESAEIVLKSSQAPIKAKLTALILLSTLDFSDPNQTIKYYDQFITLYNKNDFDGKKEFSSRKDDYFKILRSTAAAISEDIKQSVPLKHLPGYNEHLVGNNLPSTQTLNILEKYKK